MNIPTDNYFGLNKNLVKTIHYVMLFSILHMSVVVPAQEIAFFYKNYDKLKQLKSIELNESAKEKKNKNATLKKFRNPKRDENQVSTGINQSDVVQVVEEKKAHRNAFNYSSDIKEGVIGTTKDLPIDYPFDNLFKVQVAELPTAEDEVYLSYDVYGVNDINGVARSINENQSQGGYLVKQSNAWTQQKEEIDAQWLKKGENTILFTIPKGAQYQYRVRNLRIEIKKQNVANVNSLLVVNNNYNAIKDNKLYIRGFVRGYADKKLIVEVEGQKLETKQGQFEGMIALTEAIKTRNFVAIKAYDDTGLLGQELFFLNDELPPADFLYPVENLRPHSASGFKAFQKSNLSIEGASIEVVDSALTIDKEISITQLRTIDIAPLGAGLQNITKDRSAYRFLPDGTQFNKPVNITLEYNPKELPVGYTAKDIKTYYFDTKTKNWVALSVVSIDEKKHLITSSTTHFTDYINGIIQSPESPQTAAHTPTTISDIKAADPSAGITLIAPPEVSQKGDANISYPIKIPSGRKGMQPNLAIQYSSDGGNGWLGQGWNISIPAITIDTKWGVPNFVEGKETVIYSLNGEQLMYPRIQTSSGNVDWMPNRHYDAGSSSTTYSTIDRPAITNAVFTPRKQGSFAKIERLGSSPSTYYWKVTGTDGTINWYGGKTGVEPSAVIRKCHDNSNCNSNNDPNNDPNNNIVHWGLYMTEDVFGNNIKYEYDNRLLPAQSGQNENLSGGRIFHIKNIYYTGFNGDTGSYRVDFVSGTDIRSDVSINGRLGVKQIEPFTLNKITVNRNSSNRILIREYELSYGTGVFGKKKLNYIAEKDNNNKEFYRHTFDYNEDEDVQKAFFDGPVDITVPDFDANFILYYGNLLNASRLNSGETTELGWNAEIYPGLFQFFYTDNSPTNHIMVGLPFGESYTKNKGKITMADMDGNGLDDVLFRRINTNTLYYFPHKVAPDGSHYFDNNDTKEILNINNFSKTDGKTKTMFLESVELGIFGSLFGRKRFKTKEKTSIFITDGNGDMLPDIVNDNNVYFNRGVSGSTNTFETASERTPNMVITASPREIDPADVPDLEPDGPDNDYDVVRVWEAPRDGFITIHDILEFYPESIESKLVYSIEGVIKDSLSLNYRLYLREFDHDNTYEEINLATIGGNTPPLGFEDLQPSYVYGNVYDPSDPIRVEKGQRIFFRLHKTAEGPNDRLKTSPTIKYADNPGPDENGMSRTEYNYGQDFILSQDQAVGLPNTGNVQIEWGDIDIVNPSDDIQYKIIKVTSYNTISQPTEEVIYTSGVFSAGATSTLAANSISLDFPSIPTNASIYFKFIVSSGSNVKWQDIQWKPKFVFTPDASSNSQGAIVSEKNVVPNYSIYQEFGVNYFYLESKQYTPSVNSCGPQSWTIPAGTAATYKIAPVTSVHPVVSNVLGNGDTGSFRFIVKKDGIKIGERIVTIDDGAISIDGPPITFHSGTVATGDVKISCEFYVDDERNLELFKRYTSVVSYSDACISNISREYRGVGNVVIGYDDGVVNEWDYPSYDFSHYWRLTVDANHNVTKHLGTLYRGWGQFIYNDTYDHDSATPHDTYGKLINNAIIDHPAPSLFDGLGLNMDSCTGSNQEIADCIAAQISGALNLPPSNLPIDQNTDPEVIISQVMDHLDLSNLPGLGCFFSMNPLRFYNEHVEYEKWFGLADNQYSSPKEMRDGNFEYSAFGDIFPNDEDSALLVPDQFTGMNALTKTQNSVAISKSVGYGRSFGEYNEASGNAAYSSSKSSYSNSDSDFMDVNGDRYPDLLISNNAQITKMTGGHRSAFGDYSINPLNSNDSSNKALSHTGSYPIAGRKKIAEGKADSGTPSFSLGINANLAGGNKEKNALLDLNGDGLPDRVIDDNGFKYQLNLGSAFTNAYESFPLYTSIETKPSSVSVSPGISIGFNVGNVPFRVSVGYSASSGNVETSLQDINGDGLLDLLKFDPNGIFSGTSATVRYNLGSAFSSYETPLKYDTTFLHLQHNQKSSTASVAGDVSYFYGFPICCWLLPIIYYKFGGSIGGSANLTVSETNKEFKDFNGDGYADFVKKDGRNLTVYYSKLGKTDLLKSVTNPLGGKFTIDYKVQKVDFDNPTAKWAMSEVVVYDGQDNVNDGADAYKKEFEYQNAKYDRRERSFYGYEIVRTKESIPGDGSTTPSQPYRATENIYYNGSYFTEGLLKSSRMYKESAGSNNDYSLTENFYELKKVNDNGTFDISSNLPLTTYDVGGTEGRRQAGILLTKTKSTLYNFTGNQIVSEVLMQYDGYGRVEKYTNKGDLTTSTDDYYSDISYQSLNNNILNVPKTIKVYEGTATGSNWKRFRETAVTDPNTGAISSIKAYLSNTANDFALTTMEYDQYGNLNKITYPQNELGDAMYYRYEYDNDVHKFIVDTFDAFGYHSGASYDNNLDVPLAIQDLSGNAIQYWYDSFGRVIRILGPKDNMGMEDDYTIKFEYMPTYSHVPTGYRNCIASEDFKPVAITKHFDSEHPTNPIETYTFVDGLARPVQIKKDIELNTGTPASPTYEEAMSVSGITTYDDFGRAVKQYHPNSEIKACETNLLFNQEVPSGEYMSQVIYDEVNRTVTSIDPEGNVSNMVYDLAQDGFGNLAIMEKSNVDQNGSAQIITESYKDAGGKVTSTKNVGPAGAIWTKFTYNAIGELLDYTDNENISTSYKYDLLGRKIRVTHPDNGRTDFIFDKSGNLTKLITANLANSNVPDPYIKYIYTFNRIKQIIYPEVSGNPNISDVSYEYGGPGDGLDSGKLTQQVDATGSQSFHYGLSGEIIVNSRTVVGPNIPTRTFVTEFEYDSWNRIKKIVYPDGENVFYKYDLGGNLNKMTGTVMDNDYDYISQIDYDYYEQRTYLKYGNNTETFYQYTPSLRRLESLNVKTASGEDMLNNGYKYDKVGNVLTIDNGSPYNSVNQLGGKYNHKFDYDNLNRLITATGNFEGYNDGVAVDHRSDYGLSMVYNTTHGIVNKVQTHTQSGVQNPFNTYDMSYGYYDGTHKVKEITDGNTSTVESYSYDLNGNMVNKNDTNGANRNMYWDESNRLRVVDNGTDMQHYIYDASGERVLKAGSQVEQVYENGELTNASVVFNTYTTYPSAYLVIDAQQQYSKHYYAGSQRVLSKMGEQSVEIFEEALLPKMSNSGKEEANAPKTDFEAIKQNQITDLNAILEKAKRGTARFKDYKAKTEDDEVTDGNQETTDKGEINRALGTGLYFYHPDHLGTSTYLTDANGLPYQFFLNLPFGETMYEQHSYSENYASPYKFNGKELDDETGLYYYGARYYDPRTSIWLSVDPMAEKYSDWNPYNFTMQNPINLIDPDGRDTDYTLTSNGDVKQKGEKNNQPDRLFAENGDLIADNIDKRILKDGINIRKVGLAIPVSDKKDFDLNRKVGDFLSLLSLYEQKEIWWGFYGNENGKDAIIVIDNYERNDSYTSNSVGMTYGGYRLFISNHTHPSIAKDNGGDAPSDADRDNAYMAKYRNYIWSRYGVSKYNSGGTIRRNDGTYLLRSFGDKTNGYNSNYIKNTLKWKKQLRPIGKPHSH